MTVHILKSVSDALLHGLPDEDQAAIRAAVGEPVKVVEGDDRLYPDYHLVEVMWKASDGTIHTIWVEADRLQAV